MPMSGVPSKGSGRINAPLLWALAALRDRMYKEERKALKRKAKVEMEQKSAKVDELLRLSNPVDPGHPDWTKNYKEASRKEKEYRQNRTSIYTGKLDGKEFIVREVGMDWGKGYRTFDCFYIQCLDCRDLIPMDAEVKLVCKCKAITIDLNENEVTFDQDHIRCVSLMGMATSTKKKWWQRIIG